MNKKIVICCDGTWQSLESEEPTNVVKFSQACKTTALNGTPQLLYYQEGIGSNNTFEDQFLGGAFGKGIDQNIQDAYRFLCLNYVKGDQVYLFGFSRGAYTVRSLAGMIYCSGLLPRHNIDMIPDAYNLYRDRDENAKPSSTRAQDFRVSDDLQIEIELIGCWDTVGSLGIPRYFSSEPREKYKFHDTQLNRKIKNAFHALAIDERHSIFEHTPMKKSEPKNGKNAPTEIREVWFPGTHGCVGGGIKGGTELSNAALLWMTEIAQPLGLEFDTEWLDKLRTDHKCQFSNDLVLPYSLMGAIDRRIKYTPLCLHKSVKERYRDVLDYKPNELKQELLKKDLENFARQTPSTNL